MKRYEVFLKKDGRDEYRHAGSLDAPDDDLLAYLHAFPMATGCGWWTART